jgi:alpha-tubulin suppressor-like RCC1 family protein
MGLVAVAGGYEHACALTTAGGVQCWGQNGSGQLGNATTTPSLAPIAVPSLASGVKAIAVGGNHSCALTTGGSVECWGSNTYGQLGNDSTTDSDVPTVVPYLASDIAGIVAGFNHTCAVTSGGGVECWGDNQSGQLGNGSTQQSLVPVAVMGLSAGVTTLAAGYGHTCAVTQAGVECWGANAFGQLGNNSTTDSPVPVLVAGLSSGVVAIAAGTQHTCAVVSGLVRCWGDNSFSQLGELFISQSPVPVDVGGLGSNIVSSIAAGEVHTCVLTKTGGMFCWGANTYGQLGDPSSVPGQVGIAQPVSGLSSGVTAIAAGSQHTCAVLTGGVVECWGLNNGGQLGDNNTEMFRALPMPIAEP